MAIDDPISALQALNASDERRQSPLVGRAKQFLEVVKLLSRPGAEFTLGGIEAAVDWLSRREERNRWELVDAIAEEMKRHGNDIRRLLATSEEHRRFMAEEMPGLVLDALRRAEQTRAKERIRRLGQILVHAAEYGPQHGADQAEEMMRIAVELTDNDVLVLGHIREALERYGRLPAGAPQNLMMPEVQGFTPDSVLGICGKLQSLGLIATAEQHAITATHGGYPRGGGFVLLDRADAFLKFIAATL